MKRLMLTLSLVSPLVVGGCATTSLGPAEDEPVAENEWAFEGWDVDSDGFITEDEFGLGFAETGVFSSWDEDGDGLLAEEEFGVGAEGDFGMWDEDDDGLIAENELGVGLWNAWDADSDGVIGEDEWGVTGGGGPDLGI